MNDQDYSITPKFKVCRIDETANWDKEITDVAGKVYGVYFYDASHQTFCCEITPSYELTFLESVAENCPNDELAREKLYDDIIEGDRFTESIAYKHCRFIDSLSEDDNKLAFKDWTPSEEEHEDKDSYCDLFVTCVEEERGNPTFC
jgi:hypothetical protein